MSMDSFLSLFGPNADDDIHIYGVDAPESAPHAPTSPAGDPLRQPAAPAPSPMDLSSGRLPPEPQLGNVEYKLQLTAPSAQRFEHLVTQMKWRLREGNGEAIYEIGVADTGHLRGLPDADMCASLRTLRRMAERLGATTTVLRRQRVPESSSALAVAEVLVRKIPDDQPSIEVRVAVLGSAGAGKSTLLGVLTQGERDNGRGRARLNMFRHMHEIRSGRTSCVSHETLGFDGAGALLAGAGHNCELLGAEALLSSERASKLVTFMDLAGHRRYMRTTVQALTGYGPHHAMLVVASGGGTTDEVGGTAQEHLRIVLALDMPFFVVVTKIDAAPAGETLHALQRMLTAAGCRRVPLLVGGMDELLTAGTAQLGGQVVPIFCVSNVTGEGLELLCRWLYVLPPGVSSAERERLECEPVEFHVDEVFRVSGAGGPVVGGLLVRGVLAERQRMVLGPMADGRFEAVRVRSVHRNKAPCRAVRAGQSASLVVERVDGLADFGAVELRSGMVLLPGAEDGEDGEAEPFGSLCFQADVSVLFHVTAIYEGFQATVHIGSIRQTAVIVGIVGTHKLNTGDRGTMRFRFLCHPEYVKPGQRILFREGSSKGVGHVTQVFPLNKAEM